MQLDPNGLSPLPWTYHNLPTFGRMGKDWIEDANGNIVVENVGRIDGPAIVEAMNRRAPSPSPAPGVVTDIRAKIEAQHVKVSGNDGYNYAAGQEYGLRQALIIVDAALASLSQPAKEREGEGGGVEPFDDKWLGDGGSIHVLHTTPANPAQGVIRQIVEDALNSAIPEPWEVAEHATQRILAAIGAGNEPFQLVEESDEVGTQMVVASTIGAGGQAVASGAEWYRVDGDGSILLYTLMQDGWRKGEPVMVNDVMVRVEAANGSKTPIAPIAERILSAVARPVQPGWRDSLLDKLAEHKNFELSWGAHPDDDTEACWQVHRVNGGRNDREWTLIGVGNTPHEALYAALPAAPKGE